MSTMIPIDEAINIMGEINDKEMVDLLKLSLKSSYFSFKGTIHEQTHGVAMCSPLSTIIVNIYIENFERKALNSFHYTPEEWKRFVDDIFAKWSYEKEKLDLSLNHINSLSNHIKFNIEMETDNKLLLLIIHLSKKEGKLGFQVFRKKTHMEEYLHANSNQHPKKKFGIIKTFNH